MGGFYSVYTFSQLTTTSPNRNGMNYLLSNYFLRELISYFKIEAQFGESKVPKKTDKWRTFFGGKLI